MLRTFKSKILMKIICNQRVLIGIKTIFCRVNKIQRQFKIFFIILPLVSSITPSSAKVLDVYDDVSLQSAISSANKDSSISEIAFKRDSFIVLSKPVIYSGNQRIKFTGRNTTIDGTKTANHHVYKILSASSQQGALLLNTAAEIDISNLTIKNSATNGIVVSIPVDAHGKKSTIYLDRVNIFNSKFHGLHIDDNSDFFDQGSAGSDIGIYLNISNSNIIGNGTGDNDFDGIRIDERSRGNIIALITNSHIDENGGDGIELDEAGEGDVDITMMNVTLNNNGFYNNADLEDGLDIDEAGPGDINASFYNIEVKNNKDEGLDFDEAGEGDVGIKLRYLNASNNSDEGIKISERSEGSIEVGITMSSVTNNGDDGIQITEIDNGTIEANLLQLTVKDNSKYGIRIEQWNVKDENSTEEAPGSLEINQVTYTNNGKGNYIKTKNVITK